MLNAHNSALAHLEQIYMSAIKSVDPSRLIPYAIQLKNEIMYIQGKSFDFNRFKNIYVLGAGKASAAMAQAIEYLLGDKITGGIISSNFIDEFNYSKIEFIKGSHPLPDESSLYAGSRILELAKNANKDDLVIALISGGGSSLMESLPNNITLEDFKEFSDSLIKSGMEINKINILRKSVSNIKGGKLARAVYPATFISLIISDVIGNNLETIASGPTYICDSESLNPLEIIKQFNLESKIPFSILHNIKTQSSLNVKDDFDYGNNYHFIIGDNLKALQAAMNRSTELGYESRIINSKLVGEAKDAGEYISDIILSCNNEKPLCLLFGGETTVTVKGDGLGGRNQELVLSALIKLENCKKEFYFASVATDGIDGPTDAAGAFITIKSWDDLNKSNLDPREYLNNNNSYQLFEKIGTLIKTGSTGTNVMDIQILLIP